MRGLARRPVRAWTSSLWLASSSVAPTGWKHGRCCALDNLSPPPPRKESTLKVTREESLEITRAAVERAAENAAEWAFDGGDPGDGIRPSDYNPKLLKLVSFVLAAHEQYRPAPNRPVRLVAWLP